MSNGNTLQAFLSMFVPTGDGITASPGLIAGGGTAAVTQTGTPSESVLIQPGAWIVPGPAPTTQGAIPWTPGTSPQTVGPFDPADATNPRIDIVTVHVTSPGDATTAPDVVYAITKGTAAASPTAPSTPTGDVFVRQVRRNVGDTSITNARITGTPTAAKLRADTTAVTAPAKTNPKTNYGTITATTDVNGYITWGHGLGVTPAGCWVESQAPISGSVIPWCHVTDSYTSTTCRTRFGGNDGTIISSTSITFKVMVWS